MSYPLVIKDGVLTGCDGNYNGQSVEIPEDVTEIRKCPFYKCKGVVVVVKHKNIASVVGNNPFRNISLLLTLDFNLINYLDGDLKKRSAIESFVAYKGELDDESKKGFTDYFIKQKRWLMPYILEKDAVQIIELYAQYGTITKKNVDDSFLSLAKEYKAIQCITFLMEWKNKNVFVEDEFKQFEKALNKLNDGDVKKYGYMELRMIIL